MKPWSDVLYRHGAKIFGLFVILVLGTIALLRADPCDIPDVLTAVFASDVFRWLGWIVAGVILLISIIVVYIVCKIYPKELERVCKERDRLQEHLLGQPVVHSGNGVR